MISNEIIWSKKISTENIGFLANWIDVIGENLFLTIPYYPLTVILKINDLNGEIWDSVELISTFDVRSSVMDPF